MLILLLNHIFKKGIIYRFKFLLGATLFCAATTVAFFIVNNVNETQWRFHDELPILNYNAGFLTGKLDIFLCFCKIC